MTSLISTDAEPQAASAVMKQFIKYVGLHVRTEIIVVARGKPDDGVKWRTRAQIDAAVLM